ncbi:hypothetical protein CC78DRAFT_536987 [Lojkania enalia]|uniref:Uncharacterized protein n=1 Tax=Lojkania enalia TaxID=147567 RepID=A0A9P4MZH9_9PLEO|nr:hypothetical protein CC78DRAFT_536987 [Didymosphaeria enalia]
MQFKSLLLQVALASVLSQATAECQLGNKAENDAGKKETDEKLCKSQGEGDWTFSMHTHAVSVPVPGNNGYVGGADFYIFDNECKLRGKYDPGSEGNDCGVPYIIKENFLDWVLSVTDVGGMSGSGEAYFSFKYGDGKFSINNNHCDCVDASHDVTAEQKCKCAFPVNGDSSNDPDYNKRSIGSSRIMGRAVEN